MPLNLIYYSSVCSGLHQIMNLLDDCQITLGGGVIYKFCKFFY
jgi:hypothetical protein